MFLRRFVSYVRYSAVTTYQSRVRDREYRIIPSRSRHSVDNQPRKEFDDEQVSADLRQICGAVEHDLRPADPAVREAVANGVEVLRDALVAEPACSATR